MSDENFGTGVSFDEGQTFNRSGGKSSKVVELTIKYSGGLIKDEKQAQYAIIVIFIVVIVFSYIFVSSSNKEKTGQIVIPVGSDLVTPDGAPARLVEPII